ncbi:uncharacterized protein LOC109540673 [Dendroctonus ponderosae]|uniref:uncharacterized protein LOC109540673 n=1 Tax=Dendroctonus ponderosae TaxID=77166 RepID=UPI002034E05A|nr:uncharacterized protein LOC109540673 [Dendroctonus ponderosae]
MNPSEIKQKCTVSLVSMMILLVGDSNNNILLYEKYSHSYMLDTLEVRRSFKITDANLEFIKACYISDNWVGFDCCCKLTISTNTTNSVENLSTNKKQTCLDSYMGMNKVKKPRTYKMKTDAKIPVKETNKPNTKAIIQDGRECEATTENMNSQEVKKSPLCDVKKGGDNPKVELLDSKSIGNFNKSTYKFKKTREKTTEQLDEKVLSLSSILDEEQSSELKRGVAESRNCDDQWKLVEVSGRTSDDASNEQRMSATVNPPTNNGNETVTTKKKKATHLLGAQTIKPSEETNQFEQCLEDSKLNCTFIKNMSKKYLFETNQPNVNECMENKDDSSHGNPKEIMDNPDSTVDHVEFRRYFGSPEPKNQRRSINGSAFDFFPQKSIKWRSPLVHSPTVKYSPLRPADFNFEGERVDHLKENVDSMGFQDSFSSKNSNATDNSDKQANHFMEPVKKKSKHQFPLTDQEYTEDANESFSTRLKGLEDICDPEYFGLSNRRKESAVKYYSKLMNTNTRTDENSIKPHRNNMPQSGTGQNSADNKAETFQATQDLFSQSDFLAMSKELDISMSSGRMASKTPDLPAGGGGIVPTSFHPSSNPEYRNTFSNVTYNRNNGPNNFDAALPSTSKTCLDTRPIRPSSRSEISGRYAADHRYYNPYISNESSYSPRQSHYFGYPPPKSEHFYQRPMPTPPNICLCCGHPPVRHVNDNYRYNSRFENPITTPPYYGYMDERSPYSNRATMYPRVNDIPENYIDSCLQQLDVEPVNHLPHTNNSSHLNHLQTGRNREHLQTIKPESSMVHRANFNFQDNQLKYPEDDRKENIESQSLPPSFENRRTSFFTPIVENNQDCRLNLHCERQPENNRRFIKEIFTPTRKPQLLHNSPGYNRVPTVPKTTNIPIPQFRQRNQLNFNSFEERLDNIIMPNQGFSSGIPHQGVERYNNYNMPPCSNPNRQFIMDRFTDPNNHRDTQ